MADLAVLMHGQLAGTLTDSRDGLARFSYSGTYLAGSSPVPLSTSFPLTSDTYVAEAWIDGLLSDNDDVRRRWATDYGIYSTKPFDLIGSPVGRDCAGAVQFCRHENLADLMSRESKLEPLSTSDVAGIVAGLHDDDAAWNENRSETAFSLGGAQAKTALRLDDGRFSLPGGAAPTTHILKPAPRRFPDLDIVEHLCQQAARNLGIQTAATECRYFGNERALLVARYDRARVRSEIDWRRIHQEDMCQALGVPPLRKYQSDGGPTPADIADLLRHCSSDPDADVRHFLDGLIYNWLVVNTDGHAKNFSLLLTADQVRFAPLYDLCSFLPYMNRGGRGLFLPNLKMAMKVGQDYTLRKIDRAPAWGRTADSLGVARSEVGERIEDLSRRIRGAFDSAMDTLPSAAKRSSYASDMLDEIEKRAVTGLAVSHGLQSAQQQT